jgi:hypothetical protein
MPPRHGARIVERSQPEHRAVGFRVSAAHGRTVAALMAGTRRGAMRAGHGVQFGLAVSGDIMR